MFVRGGIYYIPEGFTLSVPVLARFSNSHEVLDLFVAFLNSWCYPLKKHASLYDTLKTANFQSTRTSKEIRGQRSPTGTQMLKHSSISWTP